MKGLDHVVERTVTIAARRETVFRYFTDSERFAAWWGAGSTIEPRAGGAVHVRYPNGVVAGGEVVEIAPRAVSSSPSATRAASRSRSAPRG